MYRQTEPIVRTRFHSTFSLCAFSPVKSGRLISLLPPTAAALLLAAASDPRAIRRAAGRRSNGQSKCHGHCVGSRNSQQRRNSVARLAHWRLCRGHRHIELCICHACAERHLLGINHIHARKTRPPPGRGRSRWHAFRRLGPIRSGYCLSFRHRHRRPRCAGGRQSVARRRAARTLHFRG